MDATKPANTEQRKPRVAIPPVDAIPAPIPAYPVKPVEVGAKQKVIGKSDVLTSMLRIADRDANYESAKATAWKSKDGKGGAKVKLGDKPAGSLDPAPGLPYRGTGIPDPGAPVTGQTSFKDFKIEGDLYVAQAPKGTEVDTYLTNDAEDAHVIKGMRAMVVSMPGGHHPLEFGVEDPNGKPPIFKVLAKGTETIKKGVGAGNILTKAVLAVPVDAMGAPVDGTLLVHRQFTAKAVDKDGNPVIYNTPKYIISAKDGTLSVTQVDGKDSVQKALDRKEQAAQAAQAAPAAPATPAPAPTRASASPARPPVPAQDEPPF